MKTNIDFNPPKPVLCAHCGYLKQEHKANTHGCPVGNKTRIGHIHFSDTLVYRPTPQPNTVWVTVRSGPKKGFKEASLILTLLPLEEQRQTQTGQQFIIKYSALHVEVWNIFPDRIDRSDPHIGLPYGMGTSALAKAIEELAPTAQRTSQAIIFNQLIQKFLTGKVKQLIWPELDKARYTQLRPADIQRIIQTISAATWLQILEALEIKPLSLPKIFHPHLIPQAL